VDDEYLQMPATRADEIKSCCEANANWVYGFVDPSIRSR